MGCTSFGHKFVTQTDTEIVPHLYQEYGDDFVDHINGMFAITLWDTRKKRLVIARDRYGEKPLYYGWHDRRFLFASELKALLLEVRNEDYLVTARAKGRGNVILKQTCHIHVVVGDGK